MKSHLWTYVIHQLVCFTMSSTTPEEGCSGSDTRITCYQMPSRLPSTVREVFLRDINIETDELMFSSRIWKNITLLDIQSAYGVAFKNGDRHLFSALSNLKRLGIHCGRLNYLSKEIFLGLSNLITLDLSYSRGLSLEKVKRVFLLNSSLPNLRVLKLSFINSDPSKIDNVFASNIGNRPVERLEMQGLTLIQFERSSLTKLCSSLIYLNLSSGFYVPSHMSCPRLKILDFSRTPTRQWASYFLKPYLGRKTREIKLDLKNLPSLESIYADNLSFDIPGFTIVETNAYYKCSGCKNLGNLKHLYIRQNNLRWFNATCDDCWKFKLELIDLSGNGIEYFSPRFLRTITTLEKINFNNNRLYVMQHFKEFEYFFTSFIKLRVLILSKNNLNYLPRNIFIKNSNLEEIDLSNNLLTSLPLSLTHLQKLKQIDLRNNNLLFLRHEYFVYFSALFNSSESHFDLHLSGNNFTCDCQSSQFIKWLYIYLLPRVPQYPPLRCKLDSSYITIENQAFVASQHLCERTSITTVSAVVSSLLAFVIITLMILLRRFLKRRRQQKNREEYISAFPNNRSFVKYAAFLIFCSKEEELVRNTIYVTLTECLQKLLDVEDKVVCDGFNEYRLGLTLVSETERCIRQSSVVVFVCSNASCDCLRCRREVNIACEKDKPIATILLEEVSGDLTTPLLDSVIDKSLKARIDLKEDVLVLKPTAMKFCKQLLDLASR